mmetsp:Transcript_10214/g.27786  ORF Transcript_10214/g.27786 Transcript_10214/m.27786 type:complete len:451 (-) Transcript_10214:1355-2707(-)
MHAHDVRALVVGALGLDVHHLRHGLAAHGAEAPFLLEAALCAFDAHAPVTAFEEDSVSRPLTADPAHGIQDGLRVVPALSHPLRGRRRPWARLPAIHILREGRRRGRRLLGALVMALVHLHRHRGWGRCCRASPVALTQGGQAPGGRSQGQGGDLRVPALGGYGGGWRSSLGSGCPCLPRRPSGGVEVYEGGAHHALHDLPLQHGVPAELAHDLRGHLHRSATARLRVRPPGPDGVRGLGFSARGHSRPARAPCSFGWSRSLHCDSDGLGPRPSAGGGARGCPRGFGVLARAWRHQAIGWGSAGWICLDATHRATARRRGRGRSGWRPVLRLIIQRHHCSLRTGVRRGFLGACARDSAALHARRLCGCCCRSRQTGSWRSPGFRDVRGCFTRGLRVHHARRGARGSRHWRECEVDVDHLGHAALRVELHLDAGRASQVGLAACLCAQPLA